MVSSIRINYTNYEAMGNVYASVATRALVVAMIHGSRVRCLPKTMYSALYNFHHQSICISGCETLCVK